MSGNDIQQIVAYQGELMLLGWSESHNGGRKVTFLVPDDCEEHPFKQFTVKNGKIAGQRFMAALVQIDDNEQPVEQKPAQEPKQEESGKPYGHYAQALYRNGFFFNPKVLQAIGTDEEFREWIQRQPSAYSGKFSEYVAGEGRCVAAHVRRAGDSGTAYKAEYACIPLTDEEHRLQHQKGESALGGQEWFDKKRAKYVQEWASHALAQGWFAVDSMGYVPPDMMREWAIENELMQYLPGVYKA